jgi:colicin import membrane protein
LAIANDDKLAFGFCLSLAGHFALFLIMVFGVGINWGLHEPEIYSVTIEGGEVLGGINQFEDSKRKVPVAQPQAAEKPPPSTAPKEEPKVETKPETKPEAKKEPEKTEEKAEVSLAEKKKEEEKKKEPVKEEPKKEVKKEEKPKKVEPKPTPKKSAKEQANDDYAQLAKQMQSTNAGGTGPGAGIIDGRRGTGGPNVKPPEFFAYLKTLEVHIKRGWHWYDNTANLQTKVVFNISPEGNLSNLRVDLSSGVREFDESVLRAMNKANPVPVPPASVMADFRTVHLTFDPRD